MTAIPMIPMSVGASRVVRGVRVEHVCGDPRLSDEMDNKVRMQITKAALEAVQTDVTAPTLFEPTQLEPEEEKVHAT